MALRNFWIETTVDDRAEPVATGPRHDGGFITKIFARHYGESEKVVNITGQVTKSGALEIIIESYGSDTIRIVVMP